MYNGFMKDTSIKNISDCDIKQLGCKLVCYACHGTFYDLGKVDPVCPYCQSLYSKTVKKRKTVEVQEVATPILDQFEEDEEVDLEE